MHLPEYARPTLSEVQRERLQLLEIFEASHNLSVADYAKLVGKSRRWITYEIQAGNLLSIHLGHRGQRVPDWQLDPIKRKLIQAVLKLVPRGIDTWHIYHALLRPYDALGKCPVIEAVDPTNLHLAARLVAAHAIETDELAEQSEASPVLARQTVERLVKRQCWLICPKIPSPVELRPGGSTVRSRSKEGTSIASHGRPSVFCAANSQFPRFGRQRLASDQRSAVTIGDFSVMLSRYISISIGYDTSGFSLPISSPDQ